ncbi:DUF488 domain-containing protein [Methylobacterium sp. WL64]|uniref:DUF488 domain-containing protein n=1 Tax=Methylobacterium sp. WL64 TaxID=2603894 RepID=UPI0011C8E7D8|nr:DUF488 domain-containing protein [Methylobacterium sp. WL64]TXN05930.1 DUF488 domain-containing protein [Methylobacterium sp. WL64]
MTIKTGYWGLKLGPDHIAIGVSRGVPRWLKAVPPRLPETFPGAWFQTARTEEYRARYAQILGRLDPVDIVARIDQLAQGRIPVLTCYERPNAGQWCHRSFLSCWLCLHLGLVVEEYGLEGQGFAASHPLLPAEYRVPLGSPSPAATVVCTRRGIPLGNPQNDRPDYE